MMMAAACYYLLLLNWRVQASSDPASPAIDWNKHGLELVKFLCKDFWSEIFNKQIDKLQTNHRGVFVLKDYNFGWLTKVCE